jgi:hypothetical protein
MQEKALKILLYILCILMQSIDLFASSGEHLSNKNTLSLAYKNILPNNIKYKLQGGHVACASKFNTWEAD